jgi:hypothetical protein
MSLVRSVHDALTWASKLNSPGHDLQGNPLNLTHSGTRTTTKVGNVVNNVQYITKQFEHEAVVSVQHSKPTREWKVVVLRKSNHGTLVPFWDSLCGMLGIKKRPATCGRPSGVRCDIMRSARNF